MKNDPNDYYSREGDPLEYDEFPSFTLPADIENQTEVANLLGGYWHCTPRHFGRWAPIDWYLERDGKVKALAELKCRTHPSTEHATVWINVRKWLALMMASQGMGVPSFFIAKFTDTILWIRVAEIDARNFIIGGCRKAVKTETDRREPLIDIPIKDMQVLKQKPAPPKKEPRP